MSPAPRSDADQRVLAAIDDRANESLLARLVEIPSENPPGNEASVAAEIAEALATEGIASTLDEVFAGRPNLSATLGGDGGPILLLNGHTDTMPAGEGWSSPPHEAKIREGRVYGLGSCDMKAGLAAAVEAIRSVGRAGIPLRGRVVLDAVVDEEGAGSGTKRTVARGQRADWAIIAEPTDLTIARLGTGQINFDVTFHGRAGHASAPELGHNAIYDASSFIARVEAENGRVAGAPHPLIGPASYSVGRVEGGLRTSIIPARCRVGVDRRLLPGETLEGARADLERLLAETLADRPNARAEWSVEVEYPPFETPEELPVHRELARAVRDVTGRDAQARGLRATTDAAFLADGGVPALVFGPGSIEQAHRPDEFVELAQLHAATRVLALAIARLLS